MIPLPYRVTAPAIIEAQDAAAVYVPVPGTLIKSVRVGDRVRKGQLLATLENSEVALEVAKLRGERNQQKLHLANLVRRRSADSKAGSLIPAAREALADVEERLRQRIADQQRLRLVSPTDGTVLPPRLETDPAAPGELVSWTGTPLDERNRGAFLDTGSLFCLIGDPARTEAILIVDQIDVEFIKAGQAARIQLDQWPGEILPGTITEVAEVDLKVTPRELIAHKDLPTRPDAAGVERLVNASYQARVRLDEHGARLLIDAQGRGKIDAGSMTLGRRLYRFLARTFRLELS
jgi:putative peptide zinc metalloprotease protein